MKKYTIHYNFYATIDVEVLADSEEEAKNKARNMDFDKEKDLDLELNEETVLEVEDIGSLTGIIEKAEDIVRNAQEEDRDITLEPWPTVTTEYWTGEEMEYHRQIVDNVFWDDERDEIGINTSESAADFGLSEFPDIEQLEICRKIIAQTGENK